jgi:hypothetical protein
MLAAAQLFLRSDQMTLEQAQEKIAQAYQVIGFLLHERDIPGRSEERALDYFSQTERFERDFLPWPDKGRD